MRFRLLVCALLLAPAGFAQGPGLAAYLPLKEGEVLTYHVRKAEEHAAVYRLTITVKQTEELAPGKVFSTVVLDGSTPKPKPRRLDLYVDARQITDMSGAALLRSPLRAGDTWTTPAWAGRHRSGSFQTMIVSVGACHVTSTFASCVVTRERNPLDGSIVVRTFVAGVGLMRVERFSSEASYRGKRPLRTETLLLPGLK